MDRLRERFFAEIADESDETTMPLEVSGEDLVAGREESVFVGGAFTTAAPLVAWRASNAVRSRCTRGRTASATERVVRPANRGSLWIATTGILGLILAVLGLFGVPSRVLGPHVARDAKGTSATATPVAARALEESPTSAASLDGRYAGRALGLRQEGSYVGVSIRDLPVATWILAKNPETPGNAGFDYGQVDPAELRIVRLRLEKPDGGLLHIDKLAFAARLSADGLAPGAWMYVEYEELGIANYGEIREIGPCPPIPPRPSPDHCLVTAKFEHSAGDLLNLHVAGLDEPLGVTPNHPIWSEDRQQFVRADELDEGETLRTAHDRHVRVASLAPARESAAVYNLQVDGEHVYYVTLAGVLVHNAGPRYHDKIDDLIGMSKPSQKHLLDTPTAPPKRIMAGVMNAEIRKNSAPRNILGVHTPRYPHEKIHVHFRGGGALNSDGTWKHQLRRQLTSEEREWLIRHGFENL